MRTRFAVFLASLLLLPAGVAEAVEFAPAKPLADGLHTDPQLATAQDGTVAVVWSHSTKQRGTTVQFTRIHSDGAVDPVLRFEAGPSPSDYVDPAVAVDADGDVLLLFDAQSGAIQSVLISRSGVAGPVRDVAQTDPAAVTRPRVAFVPGGGAVGAWRGTVEGEPQVVEFDAAGEPGEVHSLPGGSSEIRIAAAGGPRVVWSRSASENRSASGVFSAPLGAGGAPGVVSRVMPRHPERGAYEELAVAGGWVLASSSARGREGRARVLYAKANGRGRATLLAQGAGVRRSGRRGVQFGHLALASGSGDRALAIWTRRSKTQRPRGARLRGALLRGPRIERRVRGEFAGADVRAADAAYAGRRPVVVAGGASLSAAAIAPSGQARGVTKIRGSRSGLNAKLRLSSPGRALRAIWLSGVRLRDGELLTARGRLR